MNNREKIENLIILESKRKQLEKSLFSVKQEIKEIQNTCSHISVNLGYDKDGIEVNRCLICNKCNVKNPIHVVHAEQYLRHFDITNSLECEEKFEIIQTMSLGIMRQNKKISTKEFVLKINNLIHEIVSENTNIQLDKTNNEKVLVMKLDGNKSHSNY